MIESRRKTISSSLMELCVRSNRICFSANGLQAQFGVVRRPVQLQGAHSIKESGMYVPEHLCVPTLAGISHSLRDSLSGSIQFAESAMRC